MCLCVLVRVVVQLASMSCGSECHISPCLQIAVAFADSKVCTTAEPVYGLSAGCSTNSSPLYPKSRTYARWNI